MNPWFYDLARRLPELHSGNELLDALSDLEDQYDGFNEIDQDIAAELMAELRHRLEALPPG